MLIRLSKTPDDRSGRYMILPSTEDDVCWAAELAKNVYSGFDAIPERTMVGWFRANPHGFSTLWEADRRVGNFDVLPLKPDYMRRIIDGSLMEHELPPSSLFRPSARRNIIDLHWESVVVDPEPGGVRGPMLAALVTSYRSVFGRLSAIEQVRHMYALAASSKGSKVVLRLGMSPLGDPNCRKDKHQLFRGTMNSLEQAIAGLRIRFSGPESDSSVMRKAEAGSVI